MGDPQLRARAISDGAERFQDQIGADEHPCHGQQAQGDNAEFHRVSSLNCDGLLYQGGERQQAGGKPRRDERPPGLW